MDAIVRVRRQESLDKGHNGKAVFHVHGVTKLYHVGDVDVHPLRGIDLDLYRREFVVLLGPSGSGKSTLLNILECVRSGVRQGDSARS